MSHNWLMEKDKVGRLPSYSRICSVEKWQQKNFAKTIYNVFLILSEARIWYQCLSITEQEQIILKYPTFFFLIFLISKFYCKWKINLMGEIIHKPSVLQFRRIVFTYFDQRYMTMGLCTNYEIVFILDLWEKKTLQICSVYLTVLNIYYFQCQPDIKQRKQKNPNLVYNLQVPSPKHISPNSTCIVLRKLFCLFFPDEKSFF